MFGMDPREATGIKKKQKKNEQMNILIIGVGRFRILGGPRIRILGGQRGSKFPAGT